VGEILSFGAYSPRDVVIGWLVDDGIANRPNRNSVFDPEYNVVGIASGPHSKQMLMVACALAGNYVEGDEEARAKREVKVNVERDTQSFDRFETEDKKGYLIPCGNLNNAQHKQLKLFKEGKQLHFVKTVDEEGDQLISDYRYDIPYDFEPISVTCKFHPLTSEVFLYLAKPPGTLAADKEYPLTSFTMPANLKRPNNKMEMKSSQTPDYVLVQCISSTSKEEVTIILKGKQLIIISKRTEVVVDEEGEGTKIVSSTKTITLPFPVTSLDKFSLVSQGDEGFSVKVARPTSTVAPDAKVEIPIQVGMLD